MVTPAFKIAWFNKLQFGVCHGHDGIHNFMMTAFQNNNVNIITLDHKITNKVIQLTVC